VGIEPTQPAPDGVRPDDPVAAPQPPSRGWRRLRALRRRYLLPAGVFLLLAALTVGTSIVLGRVVDAQERRLLDQRATELTAYLQATSTQASSTLAAAGAAVATYGGQTPLFDNLARTFTRRGNTVAVAERAGSSFLTVAAAGPAAHVGTAVTPEQHRLLSRAVTSQGLVFAISDVGGVRHFLEATAVPSRVPTVALRQGPLPQPRTIPTTADSPYRELDVALYIGTRADPHNLILISGALPNRAHHPIAVPARIGADSALVVTAPHTALVGSFARAVPWIVLAGGLLVAALLAVIVGVLGRRRAYALNLVEQRTRAMQQAQLAAEAANRSKSEFLSRMSHELRTPLNAVLGFGQLLELDELTADQQHAVDQITKGGRHLLDLINEILDISRIETGDLALALEPVPLREVISESIDLVRPLAVERGVHLTDDAGARDAVAHADRQRLKQILLNLLGNGIKYNWAGGSVAVTVAPAGERVRIEVSDTGPGIPAEYLDLLFTPFERLGAQRTTIEGTGIGLALSRRLAEAMGGTVGVRSTVGEGSTFWVELPAATAPEPRPGRGRTPAVGRPAPPPDAPAVLHIEDKLANLQLIDRVLGHRPGLRLIPAMQGRLGLELARQHRPMLVLLDLDLADLPGEEVLRRLQADPVTAAIPVVIISADAMPGQVRRLLAQGASAYVTKPIDVRQLLGIVDLCLQSRAEQAERAGALAR
jgi:signal transduction histidine kinase/CheY-like chemotaxis protein